MPLNYSKWDQLELSDDSDIEGHPNVDKRSLIRWKQRDIHEKRETRKHRIAYLGAQIDCNNVLLSRITEIAEKLAGVSSGDPAPPTVYFSRLVERLETQPSKECPPGNDPTKLEQTYDGMLLSLLRKVSEEAKNKVKGDNVPESEKEAKIGEDLAKRMAGHVKQLSETIKKDQKEMESEIKEQRKHITSDDLHEGFSSKYVPPKPAPPPVPGVTAAPKKTAKETKTEFETLNPEGVAAASSSAAQEDEEDIEGDDDDMDALPELTPSLEAFSKIPVKGYERSFEFIQQHRDVIVDGASDALLVAAFRAQQEGKKKYAKQCVHQSLLLQYCEKLGKDGVRVFFKKMIQGDPRAESVFENDVDNTYKHLEERVKIALAEQEEGKEQIQLVPENPDQTISFNVPDGPPPEDLRLEGPGTEGLDIEEVRKALQFRWDVFSAFPDYLQEALKSGQLAAVNKVLGEMDVSTAEMVVQNLDLAGILSFAEGGIRDETSKVKDAEPPAA
ncbi:hypothetical protein AMATHDRAFT_154607 [Amanita thiersii Skay4041]|uniref:Hsp90 chaperone protein kinase-targeting subunit n=1 Tax=Amanita thiersii Skay4041 TaxID=703135 RepID=A0A2A9NFM5_9AGAR|nr:hypothetical protein AMATHDRAFT_154607 [Amanita thiersii Skay4041]